MKSLAIEREFGSGGREIGMRVAELAGIPYYDGELLIKAAEAQGVSIELLKTYDEQRTGSFLYDIAAFSDYARNRKNTVYELFEGSSSDNGKHRAERPCCFYWQMLHGDPRGKPSCSEIIYLFIRYREKGGTHYPNGKCFGD